MTFILPNPLVAPDCVTIDGVTYPLEPAVARLLVALHLEKDELLLSVGAHPLREMLQ